MSQIIKIIIVILMGGGILLIFLRYIENHTLFYPTKDIAYSPDRMGLKFEDLFFTTDDGVKIKGWFVPCVGAKRTILFCHGNAGNIGHRVEKLKFFNDMGCNVFIIDYRGYGKSNGAPSEAGFYKDAEAAYDHLLSRGIAPDQIIGYGESIGGAVIVDLASKKRMRGIILDSTFSSVKDMVRVSYGFVPHWLFRSRFDSESKIKSITIPKLIIHSVNDEIVPLQLGRKLYDAASSPKEFLEIYGGHNSNFYESNDILRKKIGGFVGN